MKITIGFVLALLCLFLLVPNMTLSQTPDQIAKMQAAAEWISVAITIGMIEAILQSNQTDYEEKNISAEDCIKVVAAIKSISEVNEKKVAKFKDATVKKEMTGWWKSVIGQTDAYVAYFKGDKKGLELVEKYGKEKEKHHAAINKYLGVEEE